jgi:hypothetical protein
MTAWAHELSSGTTRIGRLRVRGSKFDLLTTQRRAEAALAACRFGEVDLPDSAILCIRTFRDPLPGALQVQGPDRGANAAWRTAATAALERLRRAASRPAVESVPASSESVLFLNPAEMLASLARDWCAGQSASQWWWKALFPGADGGSAVLRVWREKAEHAPAALHQLAARDEAGPFIQALGSTAARTLFVTIAERFGLATLLPVLEGATPVEPGEAEATVPITSTRPERAPMPPSATPPPWRPWVAEHEDAGLTGDSLLLLVTALLLHRAPVVVRAPEFAGQARVRLRSCHAGLNGPEPPAEGQTSNQRGQPEPPLATSGKTAPHREEEDQALAPPVSVAAREQRALTASQAPGTERLAVPVPSSPSGLSEPSGPSPRPDSTSTASADAIPSGTVAPAPAPVAMPQAQPAPQTTLPAEAPARVADTMPGESVATEFGGVFYLINLGLFLELYGDFTTPLKPGLALPIWDFVAIVGRHLVGERLQIDPVWGLLAKLSGRDPGTEPGEGFFAPQHWPRPKDWAEFIDASESEVLRESGLLSDWLEGLMPYLRWRLGRGLGLDDPDKIAGVLCEQPASVLVTDARVEVRFALERLSIQVRLSGLDRDPGWVPAAGRFIAFRYD